MDPALDRQVFARTPANALVSSRDLSALEDLQVRNLVKNRHLATAISDAGCARFRFWVEYLGPVQQLPVLAVPPQYTSQACSGCGMLVRTSLSVRNHLCPQRGLIRDRDHHAARVIRVAGVAQATRQGVWDPVRHQVIRPQVLSRRRGSGTVGHTETERVGTARLPGSCGPPRGGRLPRLAEPRSSRQKPGRASTGFNMHLPMQGPSRRWWSCCARRRNGAV